MTIDENRLILLGMECLINHIFSYNGKDNYYELFNKKNYLLPNELQARKYEAMRDFENNEEVKAIFRRKRR